MHVCIVINRQMTTYMYSIVSNTVWKRIKLLEIQWQLHIGWRPVVKDFYIDNDLHQNDKYMLYTFHEDSDMYSIPLGFGFLFKF